MNYNTEPSQRSPYQKAKQRVDEIKGFYWHLAIYIIVHAFLVLNFFLGWAWNEEFGIWTVGLSLVGWGIGLAFHAFQVFGMSRIFGKNWEERKIREFMKQEEKDRQNYV